MNTIILDECGIVDVIARYYKCGADKVRLIVTEDSGFGCEMVAEVDKE